MPHGTGSPARRAGLPGTIWLYSDPQIPPTSPKGEIGLTMTAHRPPR